MDAYCSGCNWYITNCDTFNSECISEWLQVAIPPRQPSDSSLIASLLLIPTQGNHASEYLHRHHHWPYHQWWYHYCHHIINIFIIQGSLVWSSHRHQFLDYWFLLHGAEDLLSWSDLCLFRNPPDVCTHTDTGTLMAIIIWGGSKQNTRQCLIAPCPRRQRPAWSSSVVGCNIANTLFVIVIVFVFDWELSEATPICCSGKSREEPGLIAGSWVDPAIARALFFFVYTCDRSPQYPAVRGYDDDQLQWIIIIITIIIIDRRCKI